MVNFMGNPIYNTADAAGLGYLASSQVSPTDYIHSNNGIYTLPDNINVDSVDLNYKPVVPELKNDSNTGGLGDYLPSSEGFLNTAQGLGALADIYTGIMGMREAKKTASKTNQLLDQQIANNQTVMSNNAADREHVKSVFA